MNFESEFKFFATLLSHDVYSDHCFSLLPWLFAQDHRVKIRIMNCIDRLILFIYKRKMTSTKKI